MCKNESAIEQHCSKTENDFLFHSFWGLNGLTNVCLIIWGKCREFIRYDQICDITKHHFYGVIYGVLVYCKSGCYGWGVDFVLYHKMILGVVKC